MLSYKSIWSAYVKKSLFFSEAVTHFKSTFPLLYSALKLVSSMGRFDGRALAALVPIERADYAGVGSVSSGRSKATSMLTYGARVASFAARTKSRLPLAKSESSRPWRGKKVERK